MPKSVPVGLSVLMALRAAVDHGIDLRNHDPRYSWDERLWRTESATSSLFELFTTLIELIKNLGRSFQLC